MTHEATSRPSSTISGSWDCRTRAIKHVFKLLPADIENNDIACCNIGINIAQKAGDIPELSSLPRTSVKGGRETERG
jgi:hypothetical protein